jgi:hypothetical protein
MHDRRTRARQHDTLMVPYANVRTDELVMLAEWLDGKGAGEVTAKPFC